MSVTSTLYSVRPDDLKRLRDDNELFGALFGETEDEDEDDDDDDDDDEDETLKVASLELVDFEDTHRLLNYAGFPTLHKALDFENGNDEAFEYEGYDIQVATPATVKKIAQELAKVTLAKVREKGLAAEFRTDRRHELLKAEDYDDQFAEIERTRDFFAAAAKAGNAVVAAAI